MYSLSVLFSDSVYKVKGRIKNVQVGVIENL